MKSSRPPTASERAWREWVRLQGCAHCGAPAAIHHAVGSTGRHQGIEIGHWWVIPLCYEAHQGPHGIHGDRAIWGGERRKEIEQRMFMGLAERYSPGGGAIPAEAIEAIRGYRR